jgi:hypothetical protein
LCRARLKPPPTNKSIPLRISRSSCWRAILSALRFRHIHHCNGTVALHLIKLCVGCDSVRDLSDWIRDKVGDRKKRGLSREHLHRTRMIPKRAGELVDGGSLFWVIKGQVMCRQRLLDVRPFVDKEGVGRCHLALEPKVTLVEPRPWRAFQGWRYLPPKDAPRDLDRVAPGAKDMPEAMRRELRGLGLL